jgi:hypothetical protein
VLELLSSYTLADAGVTFSCPVSLYDLSRAPNRASTLPHIVTAPALVTASPVIAKIYEVTDPSTLDEISWTSVPVPTMTAISLAALSDYRLKFGYIDRVDPNYSSQYNSKLNYDYYTYAEVRMVACFSVVEWKWKHLIPSP